MKDMMGWTWQRLLSEWRNRLYDYDGPDPAQVAAIDALLVNAIDIGFAPAPLPDDVAMWLMERELKKQEKQSLRAKIQNWWHGD